MPRVNWMLLVAVLGLVFIFESSSALASAYGIAVTGTMVITSLLAFVVFRRRLALAAAARASRWWRRCSLVEVDLPRRQPVKFLDGGYVPLLIAAVVGLADVDLGARHRDRPAQGHGRQRLARDR